MNHPHPLISRGLLLAGAYNILGVLVFSAGFSNAGLSEPDPEVFSTLGLFAIMLWGAAYASIWRQYGQVPWLLLVFGVEKLLYLGNWLLWLSNNGADLPVLFAQAPLTGMFYAVYGAGDGLFAMFFFYAAYLVLRGAKRAG